MEKFQPKKKEVARIEIPEMKQFTPQKQQQDVNVSDFNIDFYHHK